MSINDEFCIEKHQGLCIKNEGCCINVMDFGRLSLLARIPRSVLWIYEPEGEFLLKTDDFILKSDDFTLKSDDFRLKTDYFLLENGRRG